MIKPSELQTLTVLSKLAVNIHTVFSAVSFSTNKHEIPAS